MMKLLFARRWKKIPHSRNLYPKISGHILSFSSNAQNSLLENWPGKYREPINKFIPYIVSIKDFSDKCKANYIDSKTWSSFALSFRRKLVTNPLEVLENIESLHKLCDYIDKANKIQMWPELSKKMDDNSRSSSPPSSSSSTTPTLNTSTEIVIDENKTNRLHLLEESTQFIFEQMFKKALIDLMPIIEASKAFLASNSVRFPPQWYPYARMQKRKIIYHGGPTNSGKTHQALERLRMADSDKGGGLYCGPLRLLAAEIYERLNKQGVYTDLLTGQEKIVVPFSTHLSCTLEMVNTSRQYDVAVVDEIQMIGDMDRGFAWTRALLGLWAREIHVCGGMEALTVVKQLVESCGDEFELVEYKRLSELRISEKSLEGDYSKVQPGDCVVAFAKADIFSIRRTIEELTPYKCAVIYGALPPETRSEQARLFNEGSQFQVLVASDAIGMGLNLNIKRVVFHTALKWSGERLGFRWIESSAVKQIGGRAGRLSSAFKYGEVTCWQEADLAYVRAVFQWDIPQIAAAGIAPQLEHIEMLSTSIDAQSQQPTADDESVSSLDTETSKSLKSLLQKAFQQSKRIKTQDGKSLVCIRQLYNTIKSLKESTHETLEFQMLSLKSHQSLKDWIETLTSDYKFHSNPKDSHSLLVEYAPNTKDGVATSGNSVKSEIIIKDKSSSTNQSVTPSSSSSTSNVLIEQNMKFASIEASKTSVPASSQIQLSSLLLRFEDLYKVEGPYFMCDQSSVATVSNWLHTIPLSLADRFIFSNSPVSLRDKNSSVAANTLYQFAAMYAQRRPVALNVRVNRVMPRDVDLFNDLCAKFDILELYLWLALRFPYNFIEKDRCIEQRSFALSLIESSLESQLGQQYSHSEKYKKNRPRAPKYPGDTDDIRDMASKYMKNIPVENMFKFPNQFMENKISMPMNHRSYSGNSPSTRPNKKDISSNISEAVKSLLNSDESTNTSTAPTRKGRVEEIVAPDGKTRKVYVRDSTNVEPVDRPPTAHVKKGRVEEVTTPEGKTRKVYVRASATSIQDGVVEASKVEVASK